MGRINDTVKYPTDGSISGSDFLIGSDSGGATRTYPLEELAKFVSAFLGRLKNPTSSIYDGFIIIAGENNTDNTTVQAGDYMIGSNTTFPASLGEMVVLRVLQDNPTGIENTDVDTLINLR